MPLSFEVTLEGFSGPLDLLCALVESRAIAASRVRVSDVVRLYGAYLARGDVMTIREMAEFFALAARLLLGKLQALMPGIFQEEDGSVLAELLNNPRITEDILIQILQRRDLPRSFLVRLLGDSRWRNRSRVLFLLAQRGVAGEEVLSRLSRAQLEELSRNAALPQALKERVKELLRRFSPLRG